MSNQEIAQVLLNIAALLELSNSNPYRIAAYRRAAEGVLRLPAEARDYFANYEELPIEGLGERLRNKIKQLSEGGRMYFYEELLAEQHPIIRRLMRVEGIGPRTAFRLFTELHLTTPQAVYFAARRGRVRQLRGFGLRSEAALMRSASRFVDTETPPPAPAPASGQLPLPASQVAA